MNTKSFPADCFMATSIIRGQVESYYATNDKAHRIEHADSVCSTALWIAKEEGVLATHAKEIIIAAYCHDMFADQRDTHNKLSYSFVITGGLDKLGWRLTNDEKLRIAYACLEHRSSYKAEKFYSIVSEIIKVADFGEPDSESRYHRSYNYGRSKLSLGHDDAITHAMKHIKEKFSKSRYESFIPMYKRVFGKEYLQCAEITERHTFADVKAIIERDIKE